MKISQFLNELENNIKQIKDKRDIKSQELVRDQNLMSKLQE